MFDNIGVYNRPNTNYGTNTGYNNQNTRYGTNTGYNTGYNQKHHYGTNTGYSNPNYYNYANQYGR